MHLTEKEAKALGIEVPRRNTTKQGRKRAEGSKPGKSTLSDGKALFDAMCVAHGLPVPVHEFKFLLDRDFKFDYLFDGWLAVEKEGGIYGRGEKCSLCGRNAPAAHSSIERLLSDMEKYNLAQMHGFVVLRFTPDQFESGEAFAFIKKAMTHDGEVV